MGFREQLCWSILDRYIVGKVFGLSGGDKRKNVRDAFRGAVNRAIDHIRKFNKPLAEHPKASIKHGNPAVY